MIVLASKSSGRLATLRAAGIEPQVAVSEVDERAVEQRLRSAQPDCGPQEVVQALALAKAQAVARQLGHSRAGCWLALCGGLRFYAAY